MTPEIVRRARWIFAGIMVLSVAGTIWFVAAWRAQGRADVRHSCETDWIYSYSHRNTDCAYMGLTDAQLDRKK